MRLTCPVAWVRDTLPRPRSPRRRNPWPWWYRVLVKSPISEKVACLPCSINPRVDPCDSNMPEPSSSPTPESVSLEEASTPSIRDMSPSPWKRLSNLTSGKSYSVLRSLLLYAIKNRFSRQSIGSRWLRPWPKNIPSSWHTMRKFSPKKPASLTIHFNPHSRTIRTAKFFSCLEMINSISWINGNSIRKFSLNFHSSFSTETEAELIKTSPKNFHLPKFTLWGINDSRIHPLKSDNLSIRALVFPVMSHNLFSHI